MRRELFEETGVKTDEATIAPGWSLVFMPLRIGLHEADDPRGARRGGQGADRRLSRR